MHRRLFFTVATPSFHYGHTLFSLWPHPLFTMATPSFFSMATPSFLVLEVFFFPINMPKHFIWFFLFFFFFPFVGCIWLNAYVMCSSDVMMQFEGVCLFYRSSYFSIVFDFSCRSSSFFFFCFFSLDLAVFFFLLTYAAILPPPLDLPVLKSLYFWKKSSAIQICRDNQSINRSSARSLSFGRQVLDWPPLKQDHSAPSQGN